MDFKEWIKGSGLRLDWVAEQLGISLGYLYRILNQDVKASKQLERHIEIFMKNYEILQLSKKLKNNKKRKKSDTKDIEET